MMVLTMFGRKRARSASDVDRFTSTENKKWFESRKNHRLVIEKTLTEELEQFLR